VHSYIPGVINAELLDLTIVAPEPTFANGKDRPKAAARNRKSIGLDGVQPAPAWSRSHALTLPGVMLQRIKVELNICRCFMLEFRT
jgi:hypothetical protein